MPWWKFWSDEEGDGESPDYYREGVDLARQERYHEALTSFRLARREDPDDVAPLEQIGVVYTRIGMTDEAIKAYRQVLEEEPGSAAAHYGLAFLLRKRDRPAEAAEHLEAFLAAEPEGPDAREHVRHAQEVLDELRGGSPEGEGEREDPEGPPAPDSGPDPAPGPGA